MEHSLVSPDLQTVIRFRVKGDVVLCDVFYDTRHVSAFDLSLSVGRSQYKSLLKQGYVVLYKTAVK